MISLRLRYPNGVTTINIDLDTSTVLDLQQQIRAATDILPSQQDLKSGYPPRSLELIPELPLASLGLKPGDQLIVGAKAQDTAALKTQAQPLSVSRASNPLQGLSSASSSVTTPSSEVGSSQSSAPDYVPTDSGVLIHRVVPDDNSCLFASIALVFEQSSSKAPTVRETVASTILANPETYSDAVLGMEREKYVNTILKPKTWGGAIELSALAAHYQTEIASVDVETGRVDRFEPPKGGANNRCILVYSGIHYDAATLAPVPEAPAEWHQTLFPVVGESDSDPILAAAKKLAGVLRSKRAYTNTATFDLKCEICKKGLKGEKEARAHAAETGHTSFGEY